MKLLLDTHTFLWFVEDDPCLPINVKATIENPGHEIFVSIASLWEMSIKVNLGKLHLTSEIEIIFDQIIENGFLLVPILPQHIIRHSKLPFIHRDPFDRMIIAQSLSEKMPIIGKDLIFKDYGIKMIWEF